MRKTPLITCPRKLPLLSRTFRRWFTGGASHRSAACLSRGLPRASYREAIGRYLRTDHRTGTTYVSWVRPGDDWTTQSQRFHRACVKGYVGKYASRYEGLKPARPGGRSSLPSSKVEEDAG